MITVKCTYANGDVIVTRFNGTFEHAKVYYLGKIFNIGSVDDNLQKCVNVELLKEYICPVCLKQYEYDELFYDEEYDQSYCPKCKHDGLIYRTEQYFTTDAMEYTDEILEEIWDQFGDIPINDNDEIVLPFYIWPAGTDRFEIWKWFDQKHSKGVHYLVHERRAR
jgi:hypothetical protein